MIKTNKKDLIADIEEKKELAKTRATVLSKQEQRVKETLKEQENKINEMMKGPPSGASTQPPPSAPK